MTGITAAARHLHVHRSADDEPSADPSGARRLARLRDAMRPFHKPRNGLALGLFALDLALLVAGLWLVFECHSWLAIGGGALLTWIATVRLFVIGHDACHGALTGYRWLNQLIGRIAFLPSLTPYSLWHVGHNVVHHGFNNLRGRDFVWEPLAPADYRALPRWRQALERLYRSAFGPGIYYLLEIWWKRLYFPRKHLPGVWRWQFVADCALVTLGAAAWIAGIYAAARATDTSFALLLVLGFVVPFLLWNWTVGLVIYLHHTAPDVRWFDNKREWMRAAAQATATTHIKVPWPLGGLLHNIMEHPAHHLDMTIPLYRLREAQQALLKLLPEMKTTRLTLRGYLDCVRQCKTFDYVAQAWRPFPEAQPTAA